MRAQQAPSGASSTHATGAAAQRASSTATMTMISTMMGMTRAESSQRRSRRTMRAQRRRGMCASGAPTREAVAAIAAAADELYKRRGVTSDIG